MPKSSAEMLVGLTLEGGWKVTRQVIPGSDATGGNFSFGYVAERADGAEAFVKALDFSRALRAPDIAKALENLVVGYNFERALHERCEASKTDRVVRSVGSGTVRVLNGPQPDGVQYLLLEMAGSDLRSQVDLDKRFSLAFSLRTLHHITVGLQQLHGVKVAHQDVKPSNVMVFDEVGAKIGDLGRASLEGATGPHDHHDIPGDPQYAPFEQLYHQIDPDWRRRRFACDCFQLASMAYFFFAGTSLTASVAIRLPAQFHWNSWQGPYAEVLPHVRMALAEAVDAVASTMPKDVAENMVKVIRELGEPDPALRGHPATVGKPGIQYDLIRYVSLFNLLAGKAELGLVKGS